MQSDVPPLPIACLTDNLRLRRTSHFPAKPAVAAAAAAAAAHHGNKATSVSRNKNYASKPLLPRKKKRPAAGACSPYKNSARFNPPDTARPPDTTTSTTTTTTTTTTTSAINQRVSSAKMLRIKQLQNQLADAHFHLNELSNENKLLKAIQKRQDAALKRYEGTNAELPRIINTHHEDLRVLQTKHKKLKSQHNSLSDALKEKDNELHSLQAQNKKLLQLSKDRHLGEREKLQTQVFDLTHRMSEQDETIQTLKRKLELETKYLKHQLHVEMVKHKETQKELEEAHKKLQQLERLSEQRLKRSYQASQLTAYYSKSRASVTSQSLTNLSDAQSEHPFKLHSFRKLVSESTTNQSLPSLNGALSTPSRLHDTSKRTNSLDTPSTEALASLEANRSVRLQKSPAPLGPLSTSKSTAKDSPIEKSVQGETLQVDSENAKKTYELPKSLKKEYDYSTDDEKSIKNSRSNSNDSLSDSLNYASRSRSLHARLVNSASDGVRTIKTTVASRSRSLTKENLENIMENDREVKYDRDSVVTVISKEIPVKDDLDVNTNDSNSDIESEMEIPLAYAADEDDNARRKSDVIIEDVEIHRQSNTSSHLSSLFTHLRKPANYSFSSKPTEQEKSKQNQREMNGLTKRADEKRSISNNIIKTSWDDDLLTEDKRENSSFDRGTEENDIASCAEKLLDELTENLKDTELESSTDGNMNKADLKNSADDSTVNDSAKSFDKAKLLAAMKAIDDNENIEFVEQKARKNSASNRSRITENLYRGVPTHKKKSQLMKELFSDNN